MSIGKGFNMAMRVYSVTEIYEQLKTYFLANQESVTDLNENQGMDTQLKSFAILLNQAMVKCAGGYKLQFEDIPYQVFSFPRRQATYATCEGIFSRGLPYDDEITIPVGTVVGSSSGLLYLTTEVGTILSGSADSNSVSVQAENVGSAYNVASGLISTIISTLEKVNSFVSSISASGGTDKETNTAYFRRFGNYIMGLAKSNLFGIMTGAMDVSGVQSASVLEHFPPLSGLYNFSVYIDNGSGTSPASLLEYIYLTLHGDGTAEFPGYVAPGINFRVLSASVVPVIIDVTIDLDPVRGDRDASALQILDAVTKYVNNLWVGYDVLPMQISKLIMTLPNVYNVDELQVNSDVVPILISNNQVARFSALNITWSEVHPR